MRRFLKVVLPTIATFVGTSLTLGCGGRVDDSPAASTTVSTTPTTSPSTGASTTTTPPVKPSPTFCGGLGEIPIVRWAIGSSKATDCRESPKTQSVTGHVTRILEDNITIDQCPPKAFCDEDMTVTIHIQAAKLDLRTLSMGIGDFVYAKVDRIPFFKCGTHLQLNGLASLHGIKSASGLSDGPLLTVDEGTDLPAPLLIKRTIIAGCESPPKGCGGPPPGSYQFVVGEVGVKTGENAFIFDRVNAFEFRNLRSYETGECDDYWNHAYWLKSFKP